MPARWWTKRTTRYLVNWVAGTKLIFLGLLGVILWRGDAQTLRLTSAVMALAIATFFWRLYPLALQMAYKQRGAPHNLIYHSDRGSQYTSTTVQRWLSEHRT